MPMNKTFSFVQTLNDAVSIMFIIWNETMECGDFAQVRNNCFHVDNMKELLQDIHIDSIMTF